MVRTVLKVLDQLSLAKPHARSRAVLTVAQQLQGISRHRAGHGVGSSHNETDARVTQLREVMAAEGLDAVIVPSDDAHLNEYTSARYERRSWLTGFTGSAGLAVVTRDKAALWTDGRYWVQCEHELSASWELQKIGLDDTPTLGQWLREHLPCSGHVGVDSETLSVQNGRELKEELAADASEELSLVSLNRNPVDMVRRFVDHTEPAPIRVHGLEYAGICHKAKIEACRERMNAIGVDSLILTATDEIAWLLNLRGADVPYNPIFLSFAIVKARETPVTLFVDKSKVTPKVFAHLGDCAQVEEYCQFFSSLQHLSGKVWIDPAKCSMAVLESLEGATQVHEGQSPVAIPKATKNATELASIKEAHIVDGLAMCR